MDRAAEDAFTAFVRAHGDALMRTAQLLVPDRGEAQDTLQAALLRLARHWKDVEHPLAYVKAALATLAVDRGRRRHLVPVPLPDDQRPERSSRDHSDAVAARAELDAALALLPPAQRAAVVLRVLEDFSEADAARALGCAPGTVKSNLSRGLTKVRTTLDPTRCRGGMR